MNAVFRYFICILPHICLRANLQGKKFRAKITIDGLQANQGWWFLSCGDCNWKAVEDGPAYRCTNERCGGKSSTPRSDTFTCSFLFSI